MGIFHALKSFVRRFLPRKKKLNGDFRRHRRYSLSATNLSSLKTAWQIRMSPTGWWTLSISLFLLLGALWLAAFVNTPLRNILPVKMQTDLRDEYVEYSVRLDSLAAAVRINERYIQTTMASLFDSVPDENAITHRMAESPLPLDSLIDASAAERSFVSRFESTERFNLSVLSPIAAEGMTFYPPAVGVDHDPRISDSGIPYLQFAIGKNTPVSAVYRGTVLNVHFTTGKGITIVIQHPNDFVTQYTGLAESFVVKGEKVKSGARIGLAMENRYPFTFELWHNGSPLPPSDYISL